MAAIAWIGASGQHYIYTVYDLDAGWADVPGNYIFAKGAVPGQSASLYIGETSSFQTRIPGHEKWPCVRRYGVTHIHAHTNTNAQARLREEADLIAAGPSPCNNE